jgi:Ca2+-binding RTX toxin-like protein
MTPAEQYLVEMINRARLDPLGEARRFGIDLNQGLQSGQLDGSARQVLAPNTLLNNAAAAHSRWMLDADTFAHVGIDGSTPGQRMEAAGYAFTGSWTWGENVSWSGSTGPITLNGAIDGHHQGLFLSPGHRVNILKGDFAEIGVGQEAGQFTDGRTYNASMLTENFARSGTQAFITGAVYGDANKDAFYSIGEGVAGFALRAAAAQTTSAAAGGYALGVTPAAAVDAAFSRAGATDVRFSVDLASGNAKVDLVDGLHLKSSANLTLLSGATTATLLGVANLELTGSAAGDKLFGNPGANRLLGAAGNDTLDGAAGADTMIGGKGNDAYHLRDRGDLITEAAAEGTDTVYSYLSSLTLRSNVENARIMSTGTAALTGNGHNNVIHAGSGNNLISAGTGTDTLSYANGLAAASTVGVTVSLASTSPQVTGGSGTDTLSGFEHLSGSSKGDNLTGSSGNNTLSGGSGNDTLSGGSGNDRLIGGTGKDAMTGGSGNDVFDFNALSEMGTTSTTRDVIADFIRGHDRIDLATLDANTATTTNDAFRGTLIAASAGFTAAGQLKLASGVLYGNIDADSTAEFAIQLTGVSALSAADFIL